MEQNVEEEDELSLLNYRTPKGQLIKALEQKIKKPEIDDSLGKILDKFSQLTNEQTSFLDNGVFHMNFAEDALLLQSCGQYYAKRVDKLWDELLQFHTRMIKYDETTAKNCTDGAKRDARKQEIARLEERLNRGKRKKIVLSEPENDSLPTNGPYLLDVEQDECSELFEKITFPLPDEEEEQPEEESEAPFEFNTELLDEWRENCLIDEIEMERNNYSILVIQYHRLRYRFKHYGTPFSDEMIYDMTDPEEFNTRKGRLISYHHIRHLFEYNDSCLMPDEDFTISKLRIAYILKKKWFIKNKIDPDAPYETYKQAWEKYQNDFFDDESRKIQNMPQSTSKELMRFYKALARKEQIAIEKIERLKAQGVKNVPSMCFYSVIIAPVQEGYKGIFDPYIPEEFDIPRPPRVLDISSEESQLVIPSQPLEGDHEVELSTLLGNAHKHNDPSAGSSEKPRSDSGYFDGGFEDDSEVGDRSEVPTGSDTPFEFDKENAENKDGPTPNPFETPVSSETPVPNQETAANTDNETTAVSLHPVPPLPEETQEDERISIICENNIEPQCSSPELFGEHVDISERICDFNKEGMIQALKEFIKHGTTDQTLSYKILENSFFDETDYMVSIIYDKPESRTANEKLADSDSELLKLNPNHQNKVPESKKRKLDASANDVSKRRKLSPQQIEKLKKSLIKAVKESKWEHFFSLNYHSESGEGEVCCCEYESDSEDEDLYDDHDTTNDNDNECQNDTDVDNTGYQSEHEESQKNDSDDSPSKSNQFPITQDSGVGLDTSTDLNESTDHNEQNDSLEQSKVAELLSDTQHPNSSLATEIHNSLGNLSKCDLLTELSKSTGIPRNELERDPLQQRDTIELSPYEQEREKVRRRVEEWKDYITPKLKQLDEKDFDIHEYGSNIISGMDVNQSKPFRDIVDGKKSAEVVRYFISSLQLANTLNVEICGAKKGELSNDTFELKLLNKERYHEHLQEFQAPSEETLKDRLKKIKEIRMQNMAQKKQSTKRKLAEEEEDEEYQQPITLKNRKSASRGGYQSAVATKITVLNRNVVKPPSKSCISQPSTSTSEYSSFQRPSTSWQPDNTLDHQNVVEVAVSDFENTRNRASIDSGFMPSCDEDFLEQFDQLQQISDSNLRSTPKKPDKIIKIKITRLRE